VRAVNLAAGVFAEAVCEQLGPGYAPEPALTCLSDSPDGRRVTELRFRPNDRRRAEVCIIAKQFAGDTGAATYTAMKALEAAEAVRAKDAPLTVPRALFYAPALRTLALERAPGRSYRELARNASFTDDLRLAGAALAGLHALDVPQLRPTTVDDHMAELMRPAPDAVAQALPEHAALVADVVERLLATERRFRAAGAIPQVPVHRDFHLGQLFRDRDRVAIIDWDLVALGDPALDLGNFAVYLRTRVPHAAARGTEAFFAGYAARAGLAALGRVALYEALTYLRLACKRVRLKPAGFEADAARMLRLARQRLA
jgi:aminoglycoside phosphotransferase (APT) family kinase protein